jgi:hypothetical protein
VLRLSRVLVLLVVVIVASTGQVATSSPAVSGVVVRDVDYTLANDLVVGFSFAVAPARAERVQVRLRPGDDWTPCALAAGTAACRLASPVPAAAAMELAVAAI